MDFLVKNPITCVHSTIVNFFVNNRLNLEYIYFFGVKNYFLKHAHLIFIYSNDNNGFSVYVSQCILHFYPIYDAD